MMMWKSSHLFDPINAASLALFRCLYGLCFFILAYYYFSPEHVIFHYILPDFFFSFPLFNVLGLQPLPDQGFYILTHVMGVSGLLVAVGLWYRFSMTIVLACHSYLMLLEKSYTPDPSYLYFLVGFLMLISSAGKYYSLDAIFRNVWSGDVPFWNLFFLRFQVGVAYFYSGFAKLIHSDWREARHFKIWLKKYAGHPVFDIFATTDWIPYFFSYGGMLFDLFIGVLLCLKQTRWFAIIMVIVFHAWNKYMLGLGVLTWVMISTVVLFLNPDSIRRCFSFAKVLLNKRHLKTEQTVYSKQKWIVVAAIVYVFVQVLIPLKHFLYKGNANWTHEGLRYSWHLMNNNFVSDFHVFMSETDKGCVDVQPINDWQTWWMSGSPDMILQYAHYLRDELRRCGVEHPEVYIDSRVSLNGRPKVPLIDSSVNLADLNQLFWQSSSWIMPHPDQQLQKPIEPVMNKIGLRHTQLTQHFIGLQSYREMLNQLSSKPHL